MKHLIDIFASLGERLSTFGKDSSSQEVIRRAMAENPWFTKEDILMAIDAICQEFLDKEKLQKWTATYHRSAPRKVAIIMAGNIPLVGFYDLLCVLMAGHTALVKPSSKDKVLMEHIITLLQDIYPEIAIEPFTEGAQPDMVIATGGDQAARHFQNLYSNIPTLIRGSRHSVTILSGKESEDEWAGLHRDIFSYNGLGCRNISLIFLPRGSQLRLSPLPANPAMQGNYLHSKALKTMLGVPFSDFGGYIAVESNTFSGDISQINYCYYDDLSQIQEWLSQHDDELQCVVTTAVEHPRRVGFGRAQYPTLWDVADGIDVMNFLTKL